MPVAKLYQNNTVIQHIWHIYILYIYIYVCHMYIYIHIHTDNIQKYTYIVTTCPPISSPRPHALGHKTCSSNSAASELEVELLVSLSDSFQRKGEVVFSTKNGCLGIVFQERCWSWYLKET